MITIHFIANNRAGARTHGTFSAKPGQNLMQAALAAGVEAIAADCGGLLTCATCHVIVDDAWVDRLPAPSSDELSMLDMVAAPRQPGSRLSCQIELENQFDGLALRLPDTQY